jgi:hypothetical protein
MSVFIDSCTIPLSWALSKAEPPRNLTNSTPSARIFGPKTLSSIIGHIIIHTTFIVLIFKLLYNQTFFRCHEFDGSQVDLLKWWELSDNYEAEITALMIAFQIHYSASGFNIGGKFRTGFFENKIFLYFFGLGTLLLSFLLLADPNPIGCFFHINCGDKEALLSLGYKVYFEVPKVYFNLRGHNVIPFYFRLIIFGISIMNFLAIIAWENFIIFKPIVKFLTPQKKIYIF